MNYGYVGQSKPGQPSLVDALGPWPQRVFVMVGLAVVVMTGLMVPWEALRRWARSAPAPDDAAGTQLS
jgi:uncharacterized membrane protein YwaF